MTVGVMLPDETCDGPFCMMASSSYVQLLKVVISLVGCSGGDLVFSTASFLRHPLSGRLRRPPTVLCLSNQSAVE
jgi:hypothetical protein